MEYYNPELCRVKDRRDVKIMRNLRINGGKLAVCSRIIAAYFQLA